MATSYENQYQAQSPSGGSPATGLSPMTGWAAGQKFTPAFMDQAYQNPWNYVPYTYQGINPQSSAYQHMRDFGGDPLSLYNVLAGGQGNLAARNSGDFANFMHDLFTQMGTPGAKPFDPKEVFGQLFGQQSFGAKANSTLGQLLGAGDAATQTRTLYSLARDLSNMSLNRYAAPAFQRTLGQGLDQYGSQAMTKNAADLQNPAAWLAQNMPWLVQGMK